MNTGMIESLYPGFNDSLVHGVSSLYPIPIVPRLNNRGVEKEAAQILHITVGEATLKNPDKRYSEDSSLAMTFGGVGKKQGGLVLVADGISAGGPDSRFAADLVKTIVGGRISALEEIPTYFQGKGIVIDALEDAAIVIEKLQRQAWQRLPFHLRTAEASMQIQKIGSTVSLALTCRDDFTGEEVLLIANRGDSKVVVLDHDAIETGEKAKAVHQITTDDVIIKQDDRTRLPKQHLAKFVQPEHIAEMRATGAGITKVPIKRNMTVVALSDGWEKFVSKEKRSIALVDWFTVASMPWKGGPSRPQSIANYVIAEAQMAWEELASSPYARMYHDDVSAAVMEIGVPKSYFRLDKRARRVASYLARRCLAA